MIMGLRYRLGSHSRSNDRENEISVIVHRTSGEQKPRMHASMRIAFTDLAPTWDNCVEDEVIN